MYNMKDAVQTKRGQGVITSRRCPNRYEHGARYDVLIGDRIHHDIPESELSIIPDKVTHVSCGGWAMPIYHRPKLEIMK